MDGVLLILDSEMIDILGSFGALFWIYWPCTHCNSENTVNRLENLMVLIL